MTTIYIVHALAKEVGGNYTSSAVEFGSPDKAAAEKFYIERQSKGTLVNIDSHLCEVARHIVPVELDKEYTI